MDLRQIDFTQRSSPDLDLALGLEVVRIENSLLEKARAGRPTGSMSTWGHFLHQGHQTWIGLDPEVLQTPYQELIEALAAAKPEGHLVDLGAGYGRLAFLLARYWPGVRFSGYEYVSERVKEGNRVMRLWNLDQSILLEQDLSEPSFELPLADTYFLYDYGRVPFIRKTLKQLEEIADQKKFKLIGRGEGTRSLIDHEFPWLSPSHVGDRFTVYQF